jgi:1,4-dihydroxy-2-naphthoyl-CoA hydrolase
VTEPSEVDAKSTEFVHAQMPFTKTLGVEITKQDPAEVRARMPWSEDRCTAGGVLHGGALMALADSTVALCAFLNLPEGATTTTTESKTNFLRAVREGYAESVSRPLHVGRRVIVIETDVLDPAGKLVARVTQTQAVL